MISPNRRKLLEELVPEGLIISRKWLKEETNLGNYAIDNLVKSEQFKIIMERILEISIFLNLQI